MNLQTPFTTRKLFVRYIRNANLFISEDIFPGAGEKIKFVSHEQGKNASGGLLTFVPFCLDLFVHAFEEVDFP